MPVSKNRRKNGKKGKKWKPPGSSFLGMNKSEFVKLIKKIDDHLKNVRVVPLSSETFGDKVPTGTTLTFVDPASGNKTITCITKD